MIVVNDSDTIVNLYNSLLDVILYNTNKFTEVDDLILKILVGNACNVDSNSTKFVDEIEKDKIFLYYIKNAEGNEENEFMDVIHIYGATYIIIFLDYFNGIMDDIQIEDFNGDIDAIAKYNLGNSNYFNAIYYICTVVCEIIRPFQSNNTAFAMDDTFRKAPYLIAAKILNCVKDFDPETDAGYIGMDISELMYYIKDVLPDTFKLRLLGYKNLK